MAAATDVVNNLGMTIPRAKSSLADTEGGSYGGYELPLHHYLLPRSIRQAIPGEMCCGSARLPRSHHMPQLATAYNNRDSRLPTLRLATAAE